MNKRVQHTLGNRDAARAPQGVYRCDGVDNWVALSCGNDADFAGLCRAMGRPDLISDERFANGIARYQNHDALDEEITAWTCTRDQYAAFHALQKEGVAASPVLTLAQVYQDPHLREREMWHDVAHPFVGTHPYLKPPLAHMSETPIQYWRHAPTLGQDNEYIYKEVLGYTEAEYQHFVETGHAGTTYKR